MGSFAEKLGLSRSALAAFGAFAKEAPLLDGALRYNPLVRAQVRAVVARFDRADLDGRRALSRALSQQIIAAARKTSYGREFGPDIDDWPVLDKHVVRDRPADLIKRGAVHIPASTGGTTGVPLKLVRSMRSIAAEQIFLDRAIARSGLTWANARIAILRGDNFKSTDDWAPPFGKETLGGRRLTLSGPHLTRATCQWYFDRLKAFKPDILCTWPSLAGNLLVLFGERNLSFRVPYIQCTSERLDPALRAAIESEFKSFVIDYYGQSERSCLSISTAPERFRFEPAYGKVELTPSPDDEVEGPWRRIPIISTGFWNEAMPMIRYRTGDCALIPVDASPREIEEVELGLREFGGIAGRTDEFIVGPDGMPITGLNQLPRDVDNLLQVQIVQESRGEISVRCLTQPGFCSKDRKDLEENARARIPGGVKIRIEETDQLEKAASGKTPFVIRR